MMSLRSVKWNGRTARRWGLWTAAGLIGALPTTAATLIGALPTTAVAHEGLEHVLATWNTTPRLIIGLVTSATAYAFGLFRLWRKAGTGRGVDRRQAVSFAAGWLVVFVALVSPVDALSGRLFSAHMVQHLLLILVAAPLIVLGAPFYVSLFALPAPVRRTIAGLFVRDSAWRSTWDLISQPLLVWSAFFATLWLWHVPGLYEAALRSQFIHDIQHVAFMAAACLTWWILFNPMGRLKLSRGTGVLYLFTTSLHAGALGVLLTFSPIGWYSHYAATTVEFGLTFLEDQQLAGIIMWMPGCLVYIALSAVLCSLWLRESEARDVRMERLSRGTRTDVESRRRSILVGDRPVSAAPAGGDEAPSSNVEEPASERRHIG